MNLCRSVLAASAVLALAATGCNEAGKAPSASEGRKVADVDMKIRLPDNSLLNVIEWDITGGPSNIARSGSVNVGNSEGVQFRIGGLPVGAGVNYHIHLEGTSSNNTACTGDADFDISSNQVRVVMVALLCGDGVDDPDNVGDAEFEVGVTQNDGCPVITAITALPLEVFVGSSLELEAASTSATSVYAWSGTGGLFSAAGAAETDFQCTAPGDHVLTVGISQGTCTDSWTVTVTCTPVSAGVCGDNLVNGTEQCDDGNTVEASCTYGQTSCIVCSATCQNVPGATSYCGDGNVDMTNGEECEGTAGGCLNCQLPGPVCGNSIIEAGETCDDGDNVTNACAYGLMSCSVCGSLCSTVPGSAVSYCGDSATNGPEECDDGNTVDDDACGNDCLNNVVGPDPRGLANSQPGCGACRDLNCTFIEEIDYVAGCFREPADPLWQSECVDLLDCALTHPDPNFPATTEGCAYGAGGPGTCWCGTASPSNCQNGVGINGPCMAEFTAATDAASQADVNARIRSLVYPSGYAVGLLECDRDSCLTECGPL